MSHMFVSPYVKASALLVMHCYSQILGSKAAILFQRQA